MIDYVKMIYFAMAFILVVLGIGGLILSLHGCVKQKHCVTDKIRGIYGCNRAGYCQVELENGDKGWTDNKLAVERGDHATICKRDL